MINSKEDYLFYLEADRIALRMDDLKKPRFFQDEIWKFQKALRKVEYFKNCIKTKLLCLQPRYRLRKLSLQLGYTIEPNTFGPGLSIAHRGSIVVHPEVRVAENCRIHQGVTIGSGRAVPNDIVPVIGNNVFIGPNAIITGPIKIADGISIGANSYVDRSFTQPNITIAGCPARKISNKSSEDLWIRATEILRSRKDAKLHNYRAIVYENQLGKIMQFKLEKSI